ncbi:MAG: hypothetical protein H0U49_04605 [Parachlamydiaceae bacterium]|nr:hypothetical protein [Parachlamydiaceae bacterium]
MLVIPRYFQRRVFIKDFSKQVLNIDVLQTKDINQRIKLCENKIKQLNALYTVHLLITKKAGHTLPIRVELSIKTQITKALESLNQAKSSLSNDGIWGHVKKWSGITDIGSGIKDIRSGNYDSGLVSLASGSLRVLILAALTVYVVQQFVNKSKTLDIPQSPPDLPQSLPDILQSPPVLPHSIPDILQSPPDLPHSIPDILKSSPPSFKPSTLEPIIKTMSDPKLTTLYELPIPTVDRTQIHSESLSQIIGNRKITLITAYDEGIKDYAQYVIPNQRAFASKHGYDYIEYFGNLAHDQGSPRAPYWSKIVALQDQLQKTKEGDWLAWADASALFTNTEKNFDQIINAHGIGKDIILTTDPQVPINNAVFLIKNSPWTKDWINKVWQRSDLARGGEGNCWSWGKPFCHYEQQAMTELWEKDLGVQAHTSVIPNKIMNSFYRYSHFDWYRKMFQDYDGDLESSKWSTGDFVCKVTGMDRDRRLSIIQYVAKNCVDRLCEWVKF